jgi:hypothetical protein
MIGSVTAVTLSQANGYLITTEALGTDEAALSRANLDDPEIASSFDMLLLAVAGDMKTLARTVENLLVRAKRRQRMPSGARIYLRLQIHGETGSQAYRAEITDGRLKPLNPLTNWFSEAVPFRLIVTHRAWESQGKAVNCTSAGNGTPASSNTITLGGNNNWLQIGADQIGGSLPGYAQLIVTNDSGANVGFRNWHMGVNAYSNPTNFNHMIEGEARKAGYGTVTANAGCSGGNYNAYSFTNTGNIQWELSSSLISNLQGREFLITVRPFSFTGTGLYVKPILRDGDGLIPLTDEDIDWVPMPTVIGSQYQILGSLPFPPGGFSSGWGKATLELKLKATGAAQYNVDFIQLTPLDSYQYIVQRGYDLANGDAVLFDSVEDTYAILGGTEDGQKIFSPRAGRLMLFPGVSQRLTILADEGSSSNVGRSLDVALLVHERRLTI